MEHLDHSVITQLRQGFEDQELLVQNVTRQPQQQLVQPFMLRNLLLIGLIVVGIFVWFTDLSELVTHFVSAETSQTLTPFLQSGFHYSIASIMVALGIILLYFNLRQHFSGSHYWKTACPDCQHNHLVRLRRNRSHHFAGAILRLPFRHYSCKQCAWQGTRIDHALFY